MLKDYYIITSTRRPILCYAKVLAADDNEREKILIKLRAYNIQISDYIELSRSIGVLSPHKLSTIAFQLLAKVPYSVIYQSSTIPTESDTTLLTFTSSSTSTQLSLVTTTSQLITTNQNNVALKLDRPISVNLKRK